MTTGDEVAALGIRPVTIDDLEGLIDIYLDTAIHHARIDPEVFRVPSRADAGECLRRRIEGRGPTAEYVAAIVDGRMAGSASGDVADSLHPMMHTIRTAEFGVSVLDGFRGRGIGRALIDHVERWAVEHGVRRMVLTVSPANDGAIRLYRELGYRDFDRVMLKPLAAGEAGEDGEASEADSAEPAPGRSADAP